MGIMLPMKIAVALSGGVDSAVAAYLLKQAGHDIFGLFMKNWEEKDAEGHCISEKDFHDVIAICNVLNIPYYSVNFSKEYFENVFSLFLKDLKRGFTPNPDVLCNREIKFKVLFEKALTLGADALATGHYCRTKNGQLIKGLDSSKDQSYFLCSVNKDVLKSTLFPIGHIVKSRVRDIAKKANLPVFDKKDSTGICFIGKRPFKNFLETYLPHQPGEIKTIDGKVVGRHSGAYYFTIGQRKGMEIGGPGDAWFVVGKNIETHTVIVAQGKNHPALFSYSLIASDLSWVETAPFFPFACRAKIRYRQLEEPCRVEKYDAKRVLVTFKNPQRAITPRQSIVFYNGEVCLGGAMIESAGPSLYQASSTHGKDFLDLGFAE